MNAQKAKFLVQWFRQKHKSLALGKITATIKIVLSLKEVGYIHIT